MRGEWRMAKRGLTGVSKRDMMDGRSVRMAMTLDEQKAVRAKLLLSVEQLGQAMELHVVEVAKLLGQAAAILKLTRELEEPPAPQPPVGTA